MEWKKPELSNETLSGYMAHIGVPTHFLSARLQDFGSGPHTLPNRNGLFICGTAGVGKTHYAAALLAHKLPEFIGYAFSYIDGRITDWWVSNYNARWVRVSNLFVELRATFDKQTEQTEREVISHYSTIGLLVLDDLGAEKTSDYSGQTLCMIIDTRLNELRPTIITSNLLRKELNKSDPRLASRIGSMEYLQMEGADRRLKP